MVVSPNNEVTMIITDLLESRDQQQQEAAADFHQEMYEKGFQDGEFMWSSSYDYRNNISYLNGYIAGMKDRIYKLANPAYEVDPECGF